MLTLLAVRLGAIVGLSLSLCSCTKCKGETYSDGDHLPGYELTIGELSRALAQTQSLDVLWDYESTYPSVDTRERPFELPPYPYAKREKLMVRIVREDNFEELGTERDNGVCYDGWVQAPARAILRSENGDLDAAFDIALSPTNLGINRARITEPSGHLGVYMNDLVLPEGSFRELSLSVGYDEQGLLEYASLQADVGHQNQLFTRVIFEGSRGQFED